MSVRTSFAALAIAGLSLAGAATAGGRRPGRSRPAGRGGPHVHGGAPGGVHGGASGRVHGGAPGLTPDQQANEGPCRGESAAGAFPGSQE